jgi:hypothetical protein
MNNNHNLFELNNNIIDNNDCNDTSHKLQITTATIQVQNINSM